MIFFTCFKAPEVKGNTNKNSNTNKDQNLLIELNKTLLEYGLCVSQYNKDNKLKSIMQSIPPEVCKKEYLNEVLESPVLPNNNKAEPYFLLVSEKINENCVGKIVALCYYEVNENNCTIHLLCNMYRSDKIKLGEALMNFVINSVSSKVKTISLIAETEKDIYHKLVDYYKKFGFIEMSGACPNNGKIKQKLVLSTNSQRGGNTKEYIKYNNRKYLVRLDEKKKKYIISKGSHIYINTIKYSKLLF